MTDQPQQQPLTEAEKTHWREVLQTNYLGSHDLKGKEPTATISKAAKEEVFCPDSGKNEPRLVIYFEKARKPWICNVTNAKRIADHYGPHMEDWIGKAITLRTEHVKAFGKTEPAVRVKPHRKGI